MKEEPAEPIIDEAKGVPPEVYEGIKPVGSVAGLDDVRKYPYRSDCGHIIEIQCPYCRPAAARDSRSLSEIVERADRQIYGVRNDERKRKREIRRACEEYGVRLQERIEEQREWLAQANGTIADLRRQLEAVSLVVDHGVSTETIAETVARKLQQAEATMETLRQELEESKGAYHGEIKSHARTEKLLQQADAAKESLLNGIRDALWELKQGDITGAQGKLLDVVFPNPE